MPITLDDAIAELRSSAKFLTWRLPTPSQRDSRAKTEKAKSDLRFGQSRDFTYEGKSYTNLVVDEKHFSPADLAEAWAVDTKIIRNIFRDEPGVLKIGEKSPKHKRPYITLRIPKEVAERVHKRLSA